MLSPPELWNTLFCLCSLVLLSECSIINDPKSTIICLPGETFFNVTLSHGINAGVFTAVRNAKTMPHCIRESCNRKSGQVAFLIEDSCFMVSCFKKEYCQTVPNDAPNMLRIAVTHYTFFDAAPVISKLPRIVYVKENNQEQQVIIELNALAKSRNNNNASVYFNITRGNTANAFKIVQPPNSNQASLVANIALDRENISYYYLTIQATNVDEQKFSTAALRVEVVDNNDNEPVWPSPGYSKTVYSNMTVGAQVFRVNALDSDTGDNAHIRYLLLNHKHLFHIYPDTGVIITKHKLSVDRSRIFTLIVAAINGNYRAITTVRLNVVAINEFRPFFQRLNYEVRVSEAVNIGTSVVRISATDSDAGQFAKLKFSIIKGNRDIFSIDENGDVRNRRPLTNLNSKNFTFTIGVEDSGIPPLPALQDASLIIHVVSMKRHKVKFDVPIYSIQIMENIPVSSSILTVRAVSGLSSLDSGQRAQRRMERRTKRIVYSINNKDGAAFFRVSKHTGAISTKRAIDYEKNKEFRLNITAKDVEARKRGLRVQRDYTVVIVKVIDLNDNRPMFVLPMYKKFISENTTLDKSILRVTATDADSGENSRVEYTLQHGNTNNTFSLDPDTGALRLRRSLVRSSNQFFNLTIQANDMGKPPLNSRPVSVYLKVKRRNTGPTNRPTFAVPIYLATVNESCPVHTEVLRVKAQLGRPREPNGKGMKYFATQLSGGDADTYFAVSAETGAITLIKKLDYNVRKQFMFLVAAVDIGSASSVENVLVRILIEDVNDHRPFFKPDKYNVIYNREPPLFSVVTRVEARDEDSGKNAELNYWLQGNEKGYFEINSKTGAIKIVRMLQRESLSLFRLTVSVHDLGTPVLIAQQDAEVNVLVFQPFSTPLILIETSPSTITLQFNLKYLDLSNVDKFGVITQEYFPDKAMFAEYTKLKPLTWFFVHYIQKENQNLRRYITKIVHNTRDITNFGMFQVKVGDQTGCTDKARAREYCSGPLNSNSKYRFQLRAYLRDSGPFEKEFKDGDFTESFFTGLGKAGKTYKKEGRRNYDAVVYSVGAALVLVIVLAFLRGFYRLKLDRLRIHEEKKRRISFPVSNPRFQDPESPVEKIKTPGEGRKLMSSHNTEKGSEHGRSDEDEGSSPDSALDESTRPLQRQKPTLQDIRLKSYFHSVDTESCNSCDGVRVYYMQESTA